MKRIKREREREREETFQLIHLEHLSTVTVVYTKRAGGCLRIEIEDVHCINCKSSLVNELTRWMAGFEETSDQFVFRRERRRR